ncbi:MAG: ACP S-malonyltransferase [Gammaproteobacteria bacterium]|nr:ACP S-malonyltransferase [Gammaproteobacteria bacterium]
MLEDLRSKFPLLNERLAEASGIIDEDLVSLIELGPAERLNQTEITQPVMLATSVALFEIWRAQGGASPHAVAGHSLGEYSALTVAGVFSFSDAIKLVHERGKLMQGAVPSGAGAMAAVLGVELEELQEFCNADDGVVAPANINSPGQVVISGAADAVNRVAEKVLAEGDKRKRVVPLDVSVPSHCELMAPATQGVAQLLAETSMNKPMCPIFQNVDAEAADDLDGVRSRLIKQLSSPVRWADCVTAMLARGCDALIECGPGKVLTGLSRRIDRRMNCRAISTVGDFDDALAAINT